MIARKITSYIILLLTGLTLFLYRGETIEDYTPKIDNKIFTINSNYYILNQKNFKVDLYSKIKINKEEIFEIQLYTKQGIRPARGEVEDTDTIYLDKEELQKTTMLIRPRENSKEELNGEVEAEFKSERMQYRIKLGYFDVIEREEAEIKDRLDVNLVRSYKSYKREQVIDSGLSITFHEESLIKSIKTNDKKIKLNISTAIEANKTNGEIMNNYNPYLSSAEEEKTFKSYETYYAELSYEEYRPFKYLSLLVETEDGYYVTDTIECNIYDKLSCYVNYFTYGVIYCE